MPMIELNVPESVSFKRAGHNVTFSLKDLPDHIMAELIAHGLTQKVGDAAAGKEGEEALAKMEMTYDALKQGEWGVRRSAAPGLTALETRMAELVAGQMDFDKGTKKAVKIEAAQARIAEMPEATLETVRKMAQRQLDREREEAEAVRAMAAAIQF